MKSKILWYHGTSQVFPVLQTPTQYTILRFQLCGVVWHRKQPWCKSPQFYPCDDQIVLNHLYAHSLKIKWTEIPGFGGIFGKVRPAENNDASFELNVMLFDFFDVLRGGQPWNCEEPFYSKPWLMNPTLKTKKKLRMFYTYKDCFLEPNRFLKPMIEKYDRIWMEEGLSLENVYTMNGDRINAYQEKGFELLQEQIHIFDESSTFDVEKLYFPEHFNF